MASLIFITGVVCECKIKVYNENNICKFCTKEVITFG